MDSSRAEPIQYLPINGWGFELEKPKLSPRPTPVSSNIIDNDAQMILLTTIKDQVFEFPVPYIDIL